MSGRCRLAVLLVVLAGTALAVASACPRLGAAAHNATLVSPEDPYVRLDREITAEFGMENPVVWVIEARDGTLWTSPNLARLQAMTREVFTIRGVIATDVVSLASPNLRDIRLTDDGLDQVYLMGKVPQAAAEIDVLRQRIEGDPNFRGTLVSVDGRAAMLVANFSSDASAEAVGTAALALRDRYRDANVMAYVAGAPVLRLLAGGAVRSVLAWPIASVCTGLVTFLLTLGGWPLLRAVLAALLACAWTVGGLAAANALVLPWTAYALPPTALVAAAVAIVGTGAGSMRARVSLALALPAGWIAIALIAGAPARAFGVAAAVGGPSAVVAAVFARWCVGPANHLVAKSGRAPLPAASAPGSHLSAVAVRKRNLVERLLGGSDLFWTVSRGAWLVLAVLAFVGLLRLRCSFSLPGYGEHYLPAVATADLRALFRLFPPPTALAVRVQGQPGFVTSPAVLQALDALTQAARSDAAVRSAMSISDLVKMVNRVFNDNRPEFFAIPDDRAMVGRYLALAYSPAFRLFVNRALATAAVWVYLNSDSDRDLTRVLGRLQEQLAARPVPEARVELVGGDGAVILVTARTAALLTGGGIALLLIVPAVVGALAGTEALRRSLLGACAAAALAAGGLGWLAVPIDLVSLPCLISAGLVGAVCGALAVSGDRGALWRLALVLAAAALPALLAPWALLNLFGTLLLTPAASAAVCARSRQHGNSLSTAGCS